MEILLTEKEMQNIVACQDLEEIKMFSLGEFKKWDIRKVEEGCALEYIYDEKGNLKDKFKEISQNGSSGK